MTRRRALRQPDERTRKQIVESDARGDARVERLVANMGRSEFVLEHPIGFTISKNLREHEICSLSGLQASDKGGGYVWYRVPETEIFGKTLVLSLCFHNGLLESLSLSLVDPGLYGASWDEWSEERQKRCAEDTGEWLEANGYELGRYSWGEIWAAYDPRSGSGGGGVRYDRKRTTEGHG